MRSQLRFHMQDLFYALAPRALPQHHKSKHRARVWNRAVPAASGGYLPFSGAQYRGGSRPEMALMTTDASDATADLATMAGARLLASLTIRGRAEYVCEARAFVGKAIGPENPAADVAVLLTSEIVTNAVVHSNSRRQMALMTTDASDATADLATMAGSAVAS